VLGVLESGAPSDAVLSLTIGPRASSPFGPRAVLSLALELRASSSSGPRAVLSPSLGPRMVRSELRTGSRAQASANTLSTTTATWLGDMGDATFCRRTVRRARAGRSIAIRFKT